MPHTDGVTELKRNHSQRRKNLFETDIPFKEGNTFPEEKISFLDLMRSYLKMKTEENQMALSWLEKTDQVKEIRVHETDTEVTINSKDFTYTLDRRTGLF